MTRRFLSAVVASALAVGAIAGTGGLLRASAVASVTAYSFSPDSGGDLATPGSLGPNSSAIESVTALSGSTPVPLATVYLSFTGKGSVSVSQSQCPTSGGTLNSTPTPCTTDTQGKVSMVFATPTSPSTYPIGGVATITAQNASSSPTLTKSETYHWGGTTQYAWSKQPIGQPGALSPSTPTGTSFTVTAEDAAGTPVSTAGGGTTMAIYLKFTPGATGGTAYASTTTFAGGVCATGTPLNASFQRMNTTNGVVNLCYVGPSSAGPGVDTVTAADDDSFATVTSSDFYNTKSQALATQTVTPTAPIATGGSLSSGDQRTVTVTALDSGPTPIPYATVYLCLCPASTGTGSSTAQSWTDNGGQRDLTATPQAFVTDGSGHVSVTYTAGSGTAGTDFFTSQDAPSPTAAKSVQDYYTYASATHYTFSSPWTASSPYLAARGSLDNQSSPPSVSITLTALDAADNPVPFTGVYLSFLQDIAQSSGGGAKEGASNGPALTGTPTSYSTDATGHIALFYTPGAKPGSGTTPAGGQDVITAADKASSPTITAKDAYVYGTAVDYSVAPNPVATAGSLHANDIVPVTFHVAHDSDQSSAANTLVYILLNQASGGGSASAPQCSPSTIPTSGSPAACTTDNSGNLLVDYQAPSSLPTSGMDQIVASDSQQSPFLTLSDPYSFVGFSFSPSPIAATGSLTSNQTQGVTLTIVRGGAAVGGASVWLKFAPAPGSTASASVGATTLTATPAMFTANGSGVVTLTYTRAAAAPVGGQDVITAQDGASSPTVVATDAYAYVAQIGVSPSPKIASDGSLAANTLHRVTVTVKDSQGNTAGGAKVSLKLTPTSGGGSAKVGTTSVTSTATFFTADGSGQVAVDYLTPGTLPSAGTDTLTIANETSSTPSLTMAVTYTFTPPPPPPPAHGYYMVASDGGLFPFGSAVNHSYGSTGGQHLNAPIVGMAVTATHNGYYLVATDGGLFPFGDALQHSYGSMGGHHLNQPVVGMAVTSSGNGYYLVASDGGLFPFGDALQHSYGSTGGQHLNAPIVGMALTASGNGYYLVASDGGLFPFGDALQHSYGSEGGTHLNQPIVGMAVTASGNGYYLVASDGGLFPFGDALQHSYGSEGGTHLNRPIVGMALASDGNGYYMVASDGGLFPFGSALNASYGSMGGQHLNQPIVGMAAI